MEVVETEDTTVQEGWAKNGGVRLHFIQRTMNTAPSLTPVVTFTARLVRPRASCPRLRILATTLKLAVLPIFTGCGKLP